MANLAIADKCDTATSLHSQVQAMYSTYYTGASKVQAIIDCSTVLTTNINNIKATAVNGVTNQLGPQGSLLGNGGMVCSLTKIIDTSSIFGKWADALKSISDGTWIDSVITDLQYLLAQTRDQATVQSKICGAATKTSSLINKLNDLLSALSSFPASLNDLASKLGTLNLNLSCETIMGKMNMLKPTVLGVVNPGVSVSMDSFQQAQDELGPDASPAEIMERAKQNMITNDNTQSKMDTVKNNIDAKTTALNT